MDKISHHGFEKVKKLAEEKWGIERLNDFTQKRKTG